jgi:hypothetical protein
MANILLGGKRILLGGWRILLEGWRIIERMANVFLFN